MLRAAETEFSDVTRTRRLWPPIASAPVAKRLTLVPFLDQFQEPTVSAIDLAREEP